MEFVGLAILIAAGVAFIKLGPTPRRRTVVPDFRGMRVSETWALAAKSRVRLYVDHPDAPNL